jgi:xanthine dehydrogenase large subunit
VSLRRSKALGEPPLLLGVSVWTAVKDALSHFAGGAIPKLSLPATGETILLVMEAAKESHQGVAARTGA